MHLGLKPLLALLLVTAPVGVQAQAVRPGTAQNPADQGLTQNARTATSAVGQAGQQQARKDNTSIAQAGRINNRINNRISSRLDKNYTIEQDSTSAVEDAQNRQTTPLRRR